MYIMKVFCWNIRGLNNPSRQRFIRSWIGLNKPVIGSLLETHVSEENAVFVSQSTFPGWRCEFNYNYSELGRIWLVWDPSVSVVCVMKSAQMIVCAVHDPRTNDSFSVAFVYAYNTVIQRSVLWEELTHLLKDSPAQSRPCLILGDFNQIMAANEHFSIIPHTLPLTGMSDLCRCLTDNELCDLPSRGVFFTWSNSRPEDPVLRKLDRALCNDIWLEKFPDSMAVFDPPGDSYHSPCLVSTHASVERSKKSFKYFSFLSTHPKFQVALSEAWQTQVSVGSKLFTFGQRMKLVKAACRKLNREEFGNIQQRTKDALTKLEAVQTSLMTAPSDTLFREKFMARKRWNFFAKAQECFFRQKSRVRWTKDGDANTAFFHKSVLAHQAKNCIRYLRGAQEEKIVNQEQIKDMTVSYFQSILGSENRDVMPMSVEEVKSVLHYRCPQALVSTLLAIPTDEEIRIALFKMPRNKAPGPDGFPVEFYIEAWDIVGQDMIQAVKEFFVTSYLPRGFNATTIALIPKIEGADHLSKFRPVSCCTTLYKVIARLLKKRIKLFISDAVQQNQVGFVKGRLLGENVLLASELVADFHVPSEVSRGYLQIDLTKAYDNLNWDFLFNVLRAIDLPPQFIGWIKECVSTTSFSIAFNGELIGYFPGKKGLRQGDPISSLLFVLAMDVLSKQLDAGAVDQKFVPHPQCDAPLITHLSFADDVLIFFDGAEASILGILDILQQFKTISGLGVNREKSALFIDGGDFQGLQLLATGLGLRAGSFPVRYLGVPLTSKKLRTQDYKPLLDKISKRFNSWTVKHLSFAGRLQLIRSFIYSTITFWASIFLLPNQCLEEIEHMCNAFLWKGAPNSARGAKVSWESVCTPKESGGLGLRRLLAWNKVLGLKLIWLIFAGSGSLWVSWVRRKLIGNRCFWEITPNYSGSWIWKSLCKLRNIAKPFVVCQIGSGITCSFWKDNWTSLGPLLELTGERGPSLTGLSSNAVVAEAIRDGDWWISNSRSRNPIIQLLQQCLPSPQVVDPQGEDDCFQWQVGVNTPSSSFSTSDTWHHLHPPAPKVDWYDSVWFTGHIPKHAFLSWVTSRNRMHTRDRLLSWGLQVPSTCLLCTVHNESRQHLFFDCSYAAEIWFYFYSRARVTPPKDL